MLKNLLSNEFNKNVLKLLTGTTIAQAIPIAISPILTRLYTPEDFGVLALFVAITAILGSIANARYDVAIILPKKIDESINVAALSILIAFVVSIFLELVVIFFHDYILILLGNEKIGTWLYLIPLIVFFIGVFNALNYLNTKMKAFGLIAQVKVIKSTTLATCQLVLGLFKFGSAGLIIGQMVSHIFTNGKLVKQVALKKSILKVVKLKEIKKLSKRYIDFPKFSLIATLANNLSIHLINLFINFMYSSTTLGHYSLINRTLGLPTTLIGTSIGQVFMQKSSEERNESGLAYKTYNSTFKKLIFLAIIPFVFLFFFSEELIVFIFGSNWIEAGIYMKYLLPLFFIRFISSPLSNILIVFERQKLLLIWQVMSLFLSLLVYLVTNHFEWGATVFFGVNTFVLSIHYIVLLYITFRVSNYGDLKRYKIE